MQNNKNNNNNNNHKLTRKLISLDPMLHNVTFDTSQKEENFESYNKLSLIELTKIRNFSFFSITISL